MPLLVFSRPLHSAARYRHKLRPVDLMKPVDKRRPHSVRQVDLLLGEAIVPDELKIDIALKGKMNLLSACLKDTLP